MIETTLAAPTKNTIITGDFNFPTINWERQISNTCPRHPASRFLDIIKDSLASQHVKSPTRHREGQNSTLIDLVISSVDTTIDEVEHRPGLGKSDHDILLFKVGYKKNANTTPKLPKYQYQRADFHAMKEEMSTCNLTEEITNQDVNQAWTTIKNKLHHLRDKYVPKTRVHFSNGKKTKPLWMNKDALGKVRAKHKSYRRYLSTREGIANRQFERQIAKECKNNPKAFWSYYKSKTKTPQGIPDLINSEGQKISGDTDRANLDDWKIAIVVPIHKKGDKHKPSNYRPISLTCICCKILESIIRDHMWKHLKTNNLLTEDQHGFTEKKSCVTNLLESMESWLSAIDAGNSVDVVFLDYAKAFDSVPHKRLLLKLRSYGIDEDLLGWIKSFLSNRTQMVQIGQGHSEPKEVMSGVL
jgi:hypothetical protein